MVNTRASAEPRTLDEYRKAIKDAQGDIWDSISVLGRLLVSARKRLSAEDWLTLWDELRQDYREAELKAAIAVGDGGLDPRLFPAGIIHSKVMNMTREDQERLLSGEKFWVYSDHSDDMKKAVERTWNDMTRAQRSRLISDKGGRIQSLNEQRAPSMGRTKRVQVYVGVSYRDGDSYITFHNGDNEGRLNIASIRHSLRPDDLTALVDELSQ